MKIEGNTIIFKSDPENFYKEMRGWKSNTVRTIKKPVEFAEFVEFKKAFDETQDASIQIISTLTGKRFTRNITDITPFEDHYIFSWRPE